MSVVVDANVFVAVLVADEHQPAARAQLGAWLDAREELHAPAVLAYEIANVLARLVFQGALTTEDVAEIWRDARRRARPRRRQRRTTGPIDQLKLGCRRGHGTAGDLTRR